VDKRLANARPNAYGTSFIRQTLGVIGRCGLEEKTIKINEELL